MTPVRDLKKDGFDIRIYKNEDGVSYVMEYSDDGFTTKERKTYPTKRALLDVLIPRFPASEISDIE